MPGPQAIEPALGYVETDSGPVARALKKYFRRHGVLRLSAALEAGTGQRRTRLTERQRRADFQGFLGALSRSSRWGAKSTQSWTAAR